VCVLGTSSLAGAGEADVLESKSFLSSASGEYDRYCGNDECREAKQQALLALAAVKNQDKIDAICTNARIS
jgi:hypothetical protein